MADHPHGLIRFQDREKGYSLMNDIWQVHGGSWNLPGINTMEDWVHYSVDSYPDKVVLAIPGQSSTNCWTLSGPGMWFLLGPDIVEYNDKHEGFPEYVHPLHDEAIRSFLNITQDPITVDHETMIHA